MPRKECNVIDERLKFVAGILGYRARPATKIVKRYEETGLEGLTDRSAGRD